MVAKKKTSAGDVFKEGTGYISGPAKFKARKAAASRLRRKKK